MGFYDTTKTAIKDAVTIAQQSDNIELYKKILDAYGSCIDLMDENTRLRKELDELKEQAKTSEDITYGHNTYWKKYDGGLDGPYCTCCWDSEKLLIRLTQGDFAGEMECPKCGLEITVNLSNT